MFELERITIAAKSTKTKKFTNTKLVIEKSKQNNLIENNKIIWNCSKGVYNMVSKQFRYFTDVMSCAIRTGFNTEFCLLQKIFKLLI